MSTAYSPCDSVPTMANGQQVHEGTVAMGRISAPWPPLGSHVVITRIERFPWDPPDLPAPHVGAMLEVADRIGHGSELDIFHWSCAESAVWGRRRVGVEVLP